MIGAIMMRGITMIPIAVAIFLGCWVLVTAEPLFSRSDIVIRTEEQVELIYHVEIADTQQLRSRGFMDRVSIPRDTGMVFIWPDERVRQFWMMNTPVSLDILFFDKNRRLAYIHERAKPYSPSRIRSFIPSQYVVELRAGEVARHGIGLGSLLIMENSESLE